MTMTDNCRVAFLVNRFSVFQLSGVRHGDSHEVAQRDQGGRAALPPRKPALARRFPTRGRHRRRILAASTDRGQCGSAL